MPAESYIKNLKLAHIFHLSSIFQAGSNDKNVPSPNYRCRDFSPAIPRPPRDNPNAPIGTEICLLESMRQAGNTQAEDHEEGKSDKGWQCARVRGISTMHNSTRWAGQTSVGGAGRHLGILSGGGL